MMRQRRRGRREPLVELVGPRLCCRDEAVFALRLSAADDRNESIVVLICDREVRIVLATEFEDAPAAGVATVVELLVAAAPRQSRLVVGIFRGAHAGAGLDRLDLEAVEDAARWCRSHDVGLVDVLVLGGRASDSVVSVAGEGYDVDNGAR